MRCESDMARQVGLVLGVRVTVAARRGSVFRMGSGISMVMSKTEAGKGCWLAVYVGVVAGCFLSWIKEGYCSRADIQVGRTL